MDYIGDELDIFQHAKNWKTYWSNIVLPYVSGDTLEVGAGLGGNILFLIANATFYTALEPDVSMAQKLKNSFEQDNKSDVLVLSGSLDNIASKKLYDTILYIDVMEHIEDDKGEFLKATSHLSKGGHLIILCPAHQYLFSPFDTAVGHFRRHNKKSLRGLAFGEKSMAEKKLIYLDSVGLFASLANKWLLKASIPTKKQISLWDNIMVPASKILDRVTFKKIGKTVVGVWQKS